MLRKSKFWIYSHDFTHSGAPLALAAIARELAASGLRENLRVVSWGGLHDELHSTLQHELIAEGIECSVLHPTQLPPNINTGDRLLLNTVALPEQVMLKALTWVSEGKLLRLDWYAHESDPQVWIYSETIRRLIAQSLASGRLQFRVPSQRVLHVYEQWLGFSGQSLSVQCPVLEFNSLIKIASPPKKGHFASLHLVLVGAVGHGNKGHLWLLHLLDAALRDIPNDSLGMRPIHLNYVGLEIGKYAGLTREVIKRAQSLLGDRFAWSPSCPRGQALSEMSKANILVNASLKEAFSSVCAEALALGLPLLRIQNGGYEEQLIDGVTGFGLGLPSPAISQEQIQLVNRLRNPQTMPESQLLQMASAAKAQSLKFVKRRYSDWLL